MKTTTTTELQRVWSKTLADVQRGEIVKLTRHEQVVGFIIPPDAIQAIDQLTVACIAEMRGEPWRATAARVSQLIATDGWGADRVLMVPHPDTRQCILHLEAALHIMGALPDPAPANTPKETK